jgi:hypothetical protein
MADANDDPIPESEIAEKRADRTRASWDKVHDRAMKRFDSVALPQTEMRQQSLEARRFVTIPGAMWEGSWGEQFENSPRPEVDKITKALEKIETDFRENRLTVDYVPGKGSDSDTAETLDGMHRADSYNFKAQQARDNAFQEGIRGGFGAYRLTTDYADPYDREDDSQRVNPGLTIVDADQSVYFDGGSILYDGSDAQWAFVVTAEPRDEFIERWGEDKVSEFPVKNWSYRWDWYVPDVVRKAEYYEVEMTSDKLLIFTQTQSGEERRFFKSEIEDDEIENLKAQGWKSTDRSIKRKRVRKWVMNGTCILRDCGYIAGDCIPIVPFYFRRDWVENMPRWRGYVGKMMDRQRIYNTRIGKLVETDSLAPREIPIFASGQMPPNLAAQWAQQNIDRHPYALVEPLLDPLTGGIAALGPIGKVEPPQVPQVTAALLQIAGNDLTENDDNADQVKANVSAEAMDMAAARIDAKSGIPLDNMRQTVAREGEIYLSMAREIYYEPGRKVETLTKDGKDGDATLSEPVLGADGVYKIRNDLTAGKFKVIASVTESTATARGKTVRQALAAAQVAVQAGDTELAQAYILTAAMNTEGEGMTSMQAFARNKAIGIGLEKPTPEEQQQIAQAQQSQGQQGPDPASQALMAQASKDGSIVELNKAKSLEILATAHLKNAQAQVLGAPAAAPDVPTGLQHIQDVADVNSKLAGADLKRAQAQHLIHGMGLKGVTAAHTIAHANRVQDHAERTQQPAVQAA